MARAEIAGRDRYELGASEFLIIWTTPPGPAELQAALEKVSPKTVYLFGIDPGLDRLDEFLKRLAGLTRRALNADQGQVRLSTLAAATAQREATVRTGLDWLAAQGYLVVLNEEENEIRLAAGDQTVSADLPKLTAQLKALLEETKAYRAHFARANGGTLIPDL